MNLFEGTETARRRSAISTAISRSCSPGSYVICAMTGKHIPLDELRYWSVARQEPYADVVSSFEADKRAGVLPNQKR